MLVINKPNNQIIICFNPGFNQTNLVINLGIGDELTSEVQFNQTMVVINLVDSLWDASVVLLFLDALKYWNCNDIKWGFNQIMLVINVEEANVMAIRTGKFKLDYVSYKLKSNIIR